MSQSSRELSAQVLVVNRNLQAVHITTARRAFVLMFTDVARALDPAWVAHDFESWASISPSGDGPTVGTSRGPILIPRVLQLVAYDRMPRTTIRLTRRNIFLRDGYTCQYCARRGTPRDLNLDHVMPRSRGGPMTWENVVCSCRVCNLKKGGRTPPEANMRLLRRPLRPRWSPVLALAFSPGRPAEWEPFLASLPGARELQTLWEQGVGTVHDVMAESA
ncbi:MAG: HNH endonuclease [Myxococcaceae bacterium]|nr:MAG: HNH endonuclease [Myxococcaceae bacterium]